jgi:hypothetical protein
VVEGAVGVDEFSRWMQGGSMKVFSFLGLTKYTPTQYWWKDQVKETEFFAEAVAHFIKPDEILICLTPTAREGDKSGNWQELKRRFERDMVPFKPLPIPEGQTESELWEIFNTLTNAVHEKEEVVFDITNSFRSLPFLSFLAVAYLKAAKRVDVRRVLYGAWEARDVSANRSPVFDLTPFVSLLDWLAAVNQFLYTGNARYLATQLRNQSQADLLPLAENVSEIALGLELLRPRDIVKASNTLPEHLKAVQGGLPEPFGVIVQPLEKAYAQFGVDAAGDARLHLRSQLQMINWYLEKQHFVHTLSMAREWVVSLLCVSFEEDLWDKDARDDMELLLNGGTRKSADGLNVVQAKHLAEWTVHSHRKEVAHLWQGEGYNLANLRNDVLHSGFRKNPQSAQEIIERSGKIVQKINEIARLWDLI